MNSYKAVHYDGFNVLHYFDTDYVDFFEVDTANEAIEMANLLNAIEKEIQVQLLREQIYLLLEGI